MTRAPDLLAADFLASALELLPTGPAWSREPGGGLARFWSAIADRLADLHQRGRVLVEYEADPAQAGLLLEDWERAFGLPDDCSPLSTFSRESVATYVDAAGVLRSVGIDVLRYSWDRATGANLGPLVENEATNLQRHSGVVVPGAGTHSIGVNTIDGGAVVGPDGLMTARRIISNHASGAQAYVARFVRLPVSPNTDYALSGFFRRAAGTSPMGSFLAVDEWNGTVSTRSAGVPIAGSGLGSDYMRVSRSLRTRADTTEIMVYWVGDFPTGNAVDAGCFQIETGVAASSFIYTTTAAATRAADFYFERSVPERRALLLARIGSPGGQSRDYFIALAASLGFEITIEEFRPFRADRSVAGDRLYDMPWPFTWRVHAPAQTLRYFRADRSTAGERLTSASNQALECVFEHLKPAHTTVLFSYGA